MTKYKVLSTKKLEPSLVEKAKQNDIEIIEQEFISVNPIISKQKTNEINGLLHIPTAIFTSANTVKILNEYLHARDRFSEEGFRLNIFCLSGQTYERVIKSPAVIRDNIVTADHATILAKKIIEAGIKEAVFFCGNKRRDELPDLLKQAGIKCHEVVLYETVPSPVVVSTDIDAVLFFSPSAVQSFSSVNQLKNNTVCFAIGQTTADSIADFTDNKIIISEFPSQEVMMASVNFYFQNTNCYE
jgi:uroporphyrinogen-III synthase